MPSFVAHPLQRRFAWPALAATSALVCTFVFTGQLSAAEPQKLELRPLLAVTAKPTQAALVGCDAASKLEFFDGKTKMTLAAADLVHWGRWPELPAEPLVVVPGGAIVVAVDPVDGLTLQLDAQSLQFESALLGMMKLPLDQALGVVLNPPSSPGKRDALIQKIATAKGEGDRLLLANGDQLAGTLTELKAERIKFETNVGKVDLETSKVSAVVFNPSLAARPAEKGLQWLVGLADGSQFLAAKVVLDASQSSLLLKLPGGQEIKTEARESIDGRERLKIAALQPLGGNVVYLSDLTATSYKHVPFLDLEWPYFTDRNVLGLPLRAGGVQVKKGLGMHSTARLTYDLDRAYKRFEAEAAIDDATAGRGSVIFRVLVDRDGQWQNALASPIVRGNDPPLPISVDLGGAKRLTLRVDFADRGDELDHADWLNARLIK